MLAKPSREPRSPWTRKSTSHKVRGPLFQRVFVSFWKKLGVDDLEVFFGKFDVEETFEPLILESFIFCRIGEIDI